MKKKIKIKKVKHDISSSTAIRNMFVVVDAAAAPTTFTDDYNDATTGKTALVKL